VLLNSKVFYPLVDLTGSNGPTEFAPASHMWGELEREQPCYAAETCPTHVFSGLPAGSAVIGGCAQVI
jgi:ectoine hydroxylase-related dioxygenase (phytanoyl-CoA dioxygenase family)